MLKSTVSARLRFLSLAVLLLVAAPHAAHAQAGCITGQDSCPPTTGPDAGGSGGSGGGSGRTPGRGSAPEIDPGLAGQGATLLAGAALLLRAGKKR